MALALWPLTNSALLANERKAANVPETLWPGAEQVTRVLTLEDYNTRVVLLGTVLLGTVAGVVGTLMLLRKRSLVGDVVSHASLPGIAIAFITMEMLVPGSGKNLTALLAGALIAGLLGMGLVLAIRQGTRIKEDAALAIVLSIFFGLGISLFTVIQSLPTGNPAGIQDFIFGRTSSLVARDVATIATVAVVVLAICLLLFKELSLLVCFDENFASSQGWPVRWLDALLMALVACVTVIGLQSVGLLLVVALLITPAAAARFWTDDLRTLTWLAAVVGACSAAMGVLASALFPRLATGATIVLAGTLLFTISMLLGTRRGILPRWWLRRSVAARIGQHDLMRAMFELSEEQATASETGTAMQRAVTVEELLSKRSWTWSQLRQQLAAAQRAGSLRHDSTGAYVLTTAGVAEARRVTLNHRLWELYLISYADRTPNRVDQSADLIEHVLDPAIVHELEQLLAERYPALRLVPPSPHALTSTVGGAGTVGGTG
jgi:manganese/zinc/iron transport system permease protein